jgi:4-hydroxy-3-polyprenylbenzoate decarboxylase
MAFKGLKEFIALLDERNELIRVKEPVSTDLEITEIADRFSKLEDGGKALLFENTGTGFPLLINAFGSDKRMALSLSADTIGEPGNRIEELFKNLLGPKVNLLDKLRMLPTLSQISSWMPKSISGRGQCQEVVMDTPDLTKLPVLKCWPADGGPFITLPSVITQDPETGIRNIGMYRMQVFGPDLSGMHWHKHKTGARHYNEYKKRGERMPVSVVLGGDPTYTYSATAPLPDNVDEYLLAGFLRKKRVELVKCLTNNLEVPADADIIIEGYVDTTEDFIWEGPFGDHTGFYSLADWYPKFHVTCITHRKNAVYPATIVGIPPMEDAYIGRATERIFLSPMKLAMIPEMIDMELPPAGVAHNITIAKIDKTYAGQAPKVMNSMWGAGQMMFNKVMVVTDGKTDVHNYEEVAKLISNTVNPASDIYFSQGPMDVLDHSSSKFAYGSKMGIDATLKYEEEIQVDNSPFDVSQIDYPQKNALEEIFHDVSDINTSLFNNDISVLILSVNKEKYGRVNKMKEIIHENENLRNIKFVVVLDDGVDISNLNDVCWYVSGNIEPRRDCYLIESAGEYNQSQMLIDGTRKNKEIDGFKRDWPNPVTSSEETIKQINEKWNALGLGDFIESPSLKYHSLKRGDGAVSKIEN